MPATFWVRGLRCRREVDAPEYLFAGFGAVMQGDALGVEFACSAHANLLAGGGLLQGSSQILGSHPLPLEVKISSLRGW